MVVTRAASDYMIANELCFECMRKELTVNDNESSEKNLQAAGD
ncbi:MAG: hypothetical protein ACOCP4_06925 [Candidatus Woesearchaeota archaeon]